MALFGIAVLNGIILIEHLKDLKQKGMTDMRELIFKGTKDRLRPVMLTAAAAAMGFLPMAISTGAGAEVQRPLATVVIGGLITSTMLTMIALPLLFEIFYNVKGIKLWPLKFIRSKTTFIGLILILSTFTSFGQTKEMSMQDAIQLAIQNNKELNAYALKVKESEALKPTSFSIDKTLIFYGYDQNNIAENGYPLKIFGLEQNFNFPTVYTAQSEVNKKNISIAEVELLRKKHMLTKNVSQTYGEIQYLLNKQNIYREIDSLYRNFNNNAEFQYKQGDISHLDLLNSRAKGQQIIITVNQIESNLEIAYQKLQTLIQYDSAFVVPLQNITLIPINENNLESSSGVEIMRMQTEYQNATLKLQRNRLLPDFSLSYFIGTNQYAGAKNYEGFQFGLMLPIFFGEQKARIKANKITISINENLYEHYLSTTKAKYAELKSELIKYQKSLDFYNSTGKQLSEEIIRSSQKNYQMGEINFFQFVLSIENALALSIDYLENVSKYNKVALEINYLTK
ncbi:MAG: efflux RND transporter permease subunit [Bacteroidota bacterium]|nr:efflux RND transporter permease subunit [Bacteroidota bacterium]